MIAWICECGVLQGAGGSMPCMRGGEDGDGPESRGGEGDGAEVEGSLGVNYRPPCTPRVKTR